jgi:hypothetical protein
MRKLASKLKGINLFCVGHYYSLLQHYICKIYWKYKIYKVYFTQIDCENIFAATGARFLPNAPTQNLTPHYGQSRLYQNLLHFLLPESLLSEPNYNLVRIAWMAHSYSQARQTLVIILGVEDTLSLFSFVPAIFHWHGNQFIFSDCFCLQQFFSVSLLCVWSPIVSKTLVLFSGGA